MKLFRRKITLDYIKKHYTLSGKHITFDTYKIGMIKDDSLRNSVFIENRGDCFCLCRGLVRPSYWICDIEYVYQLKQMLKIYKIL